MECSERKIDLVYTWVDGKEFEWKREKRFWQEKLGIYSGDEVNDCRFIDNQELKFSLRSVAQYAPWINRIFIITNGQIPSWLDVSHPKITIVKHSDIMPNDALPTFNSGAIETCLANIPDLSEYFLYANDDFFINKPVQPSYFFDKSGKPIVRMYKLDWSEDEIEHKIYQSNVTYCAKIIKDKYGKFYKYENAHNITPYRKSYFLECAKTFPKEFDRTCHAKFRIRKSLQRTLHDFYMFANNLAVCKVYRKKKFADNIIIGLRTPNQVKNELKTRNPFLFCINDDEKTIPDHRLRLKSTLSEIFPVAQDWEYEADFQIKPAWKNADSINIVFAPDNNFCKYFSVALQSLIENNNTSKKYDIVVFESDIEEKNKNKLLNMIPDNFIMRFVDINEFINEKFKSLELKSKNWWSVSMYYRIFIPLLMPSYNKVLYLDSDICINHDLTELFNINLEDKKVGCVVDTISAVLYRHLQRMDYMKNVLKLTNPHNYFNSGMLLFNIKNIDKNGYIQDFLNAYEIEDLLYPDQDILNVMFQNNVKFLESKWNYLYGQCAWGIQYLNYIGGDYKKEFLEARENPYIIHYTSPKKPWNVPTAEYAEIFWKYARKSPFYEEIIYSSINRLYSDLGEKLFVFNNRYRVYFKYYFYKIFTNFVTGKAKTKFFNKKYKWKYRLRKIREYKKSMR
ncbi:Stealth CR1 domain-containing protein [bacterium]|nr:Stealth CR1 domain-containing protein [bacterium]